MARHHDETLGFEDRTSERGKPPDSRCGVDERRSGKLLLEINRDTTDIDRELLKAFVPTYAKRNDDTRRLRRSLSRLKEKPRRVYGLLAGHGFDVRKERVLSVTDQVGETSSSQGRSTS